MAAEPLSSSTLSGEHNRVFHLAERALPGARLDTWRELGATARIRTLVPGETLIRMGEPIPLTMILAGHGAFRRTTVSGRQLIVGTAPPGYLFGFGSITSLISSVDVVALTPGEAATWPGPLIRRMAMRDPGLALDVIEQLAAFLTVLTEKLDGYLHQDAQVRVIRILARHRDLFFADPPILSRAHLPGLVGTSREMTSRVLRELEREGTVARVGRTGLRLLRPDQLDAHLAKGSTKGS